jgi:quercetin dioxygenase-like cupin family protein
MRTSILILLCVSFIKVQAQQQLAPATKPIQVSESELQWTDTKPPLLPGAKVAIIEGNPKSAGHFTIRLKFPPYYKIPPHVHPVDERTTVLSGAISIGFGDVMDTTQAKKLTAGSFYLNPAGIHHYAFISEKETVIQVSTNGPWGLELIDKH